MTKCKNKHPHTPSMGCDPNSSKMKENKTVIKLEAIRYCLDGLIEAKALTLGERITLKIMRRDVDKMLTPFEGVDYVESDNVGC